LIYYDFDSAESKEASFYINSIITNWDLNQLNVNRHESQPIDYPFV